ncbi:MAG: SDR family NAD(P)-dependent oxidoreductase, partial [Anaerolineae bacterium]|nr:SDR family NAD(P)-dependent oxidoreductase [Anaerolineae bacterium]
MVRAFVTGSSAGLGLLAGQMLVGQGHQVVLHARTEAKARALRAAVPGAAGVLVADLEDMAAVRSLAEAANATGRFDAVIHNAGVLGAGTDRIGPDGVPVIFAVNVLAPYLLTALMQRPGRLVYLGSSMHVGAGV